MITIYNLVKNNSGKIDKFDLDLIIAHVIKKPREFVLAHPEYSVNKNQRSIINKLLKRRLKHEPTAYILGHKEFFGLDFKVNRQTLIPRPETEMLVDEGLFLARGMVRGMPRGKAAIIDIGTGSGNIIISIAKNISKNKNQRTMNNIKLYATDISSGALRVAKHNAKKNKVDKKIKFIKSDLLKYFIDHCSLFINHCIILANLPYLSQKIYSSSMPDVKNYEPKSALFSGSSGLSHYEKLLKQILKLKNSYFFIHASCFFEISPEQKNSFQKLIRKYFPEIKAEFRKDLAGKWRVAILKI